MSHNWRLTAQAESLKVAVLGMWLSSIHGSTLQARAVLLVIVFELTCADVSLGGGVLVRSLNDSRSINQQPAAVKN